MKQNTLVLDEQEMSITNAEYGIYNARNDIKVKLYTAGDNYVTIYFNQALHVDKLIPLNKKEEEQNKGWYWGVVYSTPQGTLFEGYGDPDPDYPTFKEGTLLITNFTGDNIKVVLKNGKIMGRDGKVYTLNLHYEGKIKLTEQGV